MKIYHMIIEKLKTEQRGNTKSTYGDSTTRREYLSRTQGKAPAGWICVGVCGYHEEPKKGQEDENQ